MKSLLIVLFAFLQFSAVAQSLESKVHKFIGQSWPKEANERSMLGKAGQDLMNELGPASKYYAAIAFRSGSLFTAAGDYREAEAIYKDGLKAGTLTPAQHGAFWLMLGQSQEQQGKNAVALLSFREAEKRSGALKVNERELLKSWIAYLELRSTNSEEVKRRTALVLNAVESGQFSAALQGDLQYVYENSPQLSKALSSKIFRRLANGSAPSDYDLANITFSYEPAFTHGISMEGTDSYAEKITNRLKKSKNSESSLLTKLYWAQALGTKPSRQEALEFTAHVVKGLDAKGMSSEARGLAISLVHELEAYASASDAKAQKIIREALHRLNAESVVVTPDSDGSKNAPVIPLLAITGGIVLLICLPFAIRRLRRGKAS